MRIYNLKEGDVVCRPAWEVRKLYITIINGEPYYIDRDKKPKKARPDSTCHNHIDYYLVENKTTKEEKMCKPYGATNIVMLDNTGKMFAFESIEECHEGIQDILLQDPKRKFKIFKLYQSVEPKRVDLKDLITQF
jgi:hypothetical protein